MRASKSDPKLPEKTARKRQSGNSVAKVPRSVAPAGSIGHAMLEWKRKHLAARLLAERKALRREEKRDLPGLSKAAIDDLFPLTLLDHDYRNAELTAEECKGLADHLRHRFPDYEVHVTIGVQDKIDVERRAIRKRSLGAVPDFAERWPQLSLAARNMVKDDFYGTMAKPGARLFIITPEGKSLFSEHSSPRVLDLRTRDLWASDPIATRQAKLELRRLQLIESFNERVHYGGVSRLLPFVQYQRDLARELLSVLDELCKIQERPGVHCDVCGEELPTKDKNGRPLPKRDQRKSCAKHTSQGRDYRRGLHKPNPETRTAATEEFVKARFSNSGWAAGGRRTRR